ncbi:hypothetical protein B0J13DRAFT_253805 [Dactylonectria estremocensis]|uniref:Uncharacterized protein n=1 Tax=Dactylonectria estremocensis TaxID=1079267 RepID=A0A9P9F480_9HYPO|nr:hypothetical protein B0J13DRAFT_253805 [Dactylonectria estremocensis]
MLSREELILAWRLGMAPRTPVVGFQSKRCSYSGEPTDRNRRRRPTSQVQDQDQYDLGKVRRESECVRPGESGPRIVTEKEQFHDRGSAARPWPTPSSSSFQGEKVPYPSVCTSLGRYLAMCPAHPRQGSTDRAWPNLATPLYRLDMGGSSSPVHRQYFETHQNKQCRQVSGEIDLLWPPALRAKSCPTISPFSARGLGPRAAHRSPMPRRRLERSTRLQRRLLAKRGTRIARWAWPSI